MHPCLCFIWQFFFIYYVVHFHIVFFLALHATSCCSSWRTVIHAETATWKRSIGKAVLHRQPCQNVPAASNFADLQAIIYHLLHTGVPEEPPSGQKTLLPTSSVTLLYVACYYKSFWHGWQGSFLPTCNTVLEREAQDKLQNIILHSAT